MEREQSKLHPGRDSGGPGTGCGASVYTQDSGLPALPQLASCAGAEVAGHLLHLQAPQNWARASWSDSGPPVWAPAVPLPENHSGQGDPGLSVARPGRVFTLTAPERGGGEVLRKETAGHSAVCPQSVTAQISWVGISAAVQALTRRGVAFWDLRSCADQARPADPLTT